MLSTDVWISLLGSLAIVAVGYGALRARVAALESKVRELGGELRDANIRQGERLGGLEQWRAGETAREKERRRLTGAVPVREED